MNLALGGLAKDSLRSMQRQDTTERRRWPRYPVRWVVRLFIGDADTIMTETVDFSLHGVRLALSEEVGAPPLRLGDKCLFEVSLSNSEAKFVRVGEVRHIGDAGVGLKMLEPLPEGVTYLLSLLNGAIASRQH